MKTYSGPCNTHPVRNRCLIDRFTCSRVDRTGQRLISFKFQNGIYAHSVRCWFSCYHICLKNNCSIYNIPHMLGCNIYFCISTSPVLCIMGSCRLDISWFFLDHFSLFYALDQCCGFCCLIHRPSVSSTGNIHCLAGRCRDRSCRTDCIISLAKFPHPLFYLILIKGNIHIFIIRQPL